MRTRRGFYMGEKQPGSLAAPAHEETLTVKTSNNVRRASSFSVFSIVLSTLFQARHRIPRNHLNPTIDFVLLVALMGLYCSTP